MLNARFELLKNQLQPHFLFNSLNGILSAVDGNKEVAKAMIIKLSALLRESLLIDYSKQITIEKELELLVGYLEIVKFRYSSTKGNKALKKNIAFELDKSKLSIMISNDGKPIGRLRKGLGILNLENRMKAVYGDNFTFNLSQQGIWVCNHLILHL